MTEQAPPEVPPTSPILGFHLGEAQGRTHPDLFPFWGGTLVGGPGSTESVQKMREEDALFHSRPSSRGFFFGFGVEKT